MSITAPRRPMTQAERRAATRAALLDAVIECIVEVGYTKTTTRMIAERAGVTAGAQAHYFATKTDLVAEAIERLATQICDEILKQAPSGGRPSRGQLERFLDEIWALHCGPLFQAAMDLWAAARTDPELRTSLHRAQRAISARVAEIAAQLLGQPGIDQSLAQAINADLAAIRGIAMLRGVSEHDADALWRSTRPQLVDQTISAWRAQRA
jgi:AcrR family transcriptional regulator